MIHKTGDLRALIIATDALTRSGLSAVLSAQEGIWPVGQLASAADLARTLDVYQPDVILWDCGWSAEPATESVLEMAALSGAHEPPPVVALAADGEQGRVLWQMGMRSILLRTLDPHALSAALAAAAGGLWVISPELAAGIPILRNESLADDLEPLTNRELQVLQLMAEGLANRAIARRLEISEHTVKFHVNAIFGKLGAQSRTEAVVRATRAGLVLL